MTSSNITATSVDLTWDAVTFTGGVTYNVYRDDVLITNVATNTYSDTGLTASTTYKYYMTAVSTANGNESVPGDTETVTTAAV